MSMCRYFFNSDSMLKSFSPTRQIDEEQLKSIFLCMSLVTLTVFTRLNISLWVFFLTWMMWFKQYITQAVWEYKECKFKFVLKHRAHMFLTWWVCLEWSVWQVSQRSCPLREDSCCCCWCSPLHLFFSSAAYTSQAKFIHPFTGLSFCMFHCLYCASDI